MVHVVTYQLPDSDLDPYLYITDSVCLTGIPLLDNKVSAEDYLRFAAEDLGTDNARGAINALGNAKRALHLTIDSTLNAYGLLARNKRASFPQKLKLLDAAGLFSLSILNTLNLERNAMEHEYVAPTSARASEVVDVTRLLLLATERMRQYVVYECLAGWKATSTHGILQLNPFEGYLSFFKVSGEGVRISGPHTSLPETALLPIRTPSGGLISCVTIDPDPLWSVELGLRNLNEWPPLLKPIIEQAEVFHGNRITDPVFYEDTVRLGMTVHLPRAADPEGLRRLMAAGRGVLDSGSFTFLPIRRDAQQ